jgi:hypothetical protein
MTYRRLRQAQSLAGPDNGSLFHDDVEHDQEIQIELAQKHVIHLPTAAKSQQRFRWSLTILSQLQLLGADAPENRPAIHLICSPSEPHDAIRSYKSRFLLSQMWVLAAYGVLAHR